MNGVLLRAARSAASCRFSAGAGGLALGRSLLLRSGFGRLGVAVALVQEAPLRVSGAVVAAGVLLVLFI